MFDWITTLIEQWGYPGIALLMFLENVFPPIPSELIMPLAGFKAARGSLSLPLVIASGSAGSIAGAWVWYWIGKKLGLRGVERLARRHGRWLTMDPAEVGRASDWFHRHGGSAVLLGRLVPAVRSLISVPAGINRMSLPRFLVLSSIGTAVWTSLLVLAGYVLDAGYETVADYLNPVSNVVFALLAGWYLYRVVTFGRPARD